MLQTTMKMTITLFLLLMFVGKSLHLCKNNTNNCTVCNTTDTTRCAECSLDLIVTVSGVCSSCYDDNCLTCTHHINKCQQCKTGYGVNNVLKCSKCSSHCQQCSTDVMDCTLCAPLYGINLTFTGYGYCLACNDTNCNSCSDYYHSCDNCKSGYRRAIAHVNYYCYQCDDHLCATCPDDTSICTNCTHGYFPVNNLTCTACSVTRCKQCSTSLHTCQLCIDGYGLQSSGLCISCKTYQPVCQLCGANASYCTSCNVPNLGPNEFGQCTICAQRYSCLDCHTNNTLCLSCDITSQLIDNHCIPCNVTSCVNCTNNYQQCSQCIGSLGVDTTTFQCVDCMNNMYYIQNYFCQPCLTKCLKCTDSTYCSKCVDGYYLQVSTTIDNMTVNNTYTCPVCPQLCALCQNVNEKPNCTKCMQQTHIVNLGDGYFRCNQICGDERAYYYKCDLQLYIAYDGCSDTCTVDPDFDCTVDTNKHTTCSYERVVNLQILAFGIYPIHNGITIVFSVQPPLDVFSSVDLRQVFTINNSIFTVGTVKSISTQEYNSLSSTSSSIINGEIQRFTGIVEMTAQLTQQYNQNIPLIFVPNTAVDPRFGKTPQSSFNINNNGAIYFYSPFMLIISNVIYYLSLIIVIIVWIGIPISIYARKWSNIQCIFAVQILWIVVVYFNQNLYLPVYEMLPLKYSTFYNVQLISSSTKIQIYSPANWHFILYPTNSPYLSTFGYDTQYFANNFNLCMLMQFLCFVSFVILKLYLIYLDAQYQKSLVICDDSQIILKMKINKMNEILSIFCKCFMCFGMINIVYFTFCICIYVIFSTNIFNTSSIILIAFELLLYVINVIMLFIYADLFDYFRYAFKKQRLAMLHCYFYTVALIGTVILIIMFNKNTYYSSIPFGVLFIYTVVYRPFREIKDNILSILINFIILACVSLRIFIQFFNEQFQNTIYLYAYLLGCITLLLIVSMISIGISSYHIYYVHFIQPNLQKTGKQKVMLELQNMKIRQNIKNVPANSSSENVYKYILKPKQNVFDYSNQIMNQIATNRSANAYLIPQQTVDNEHFDSTKTKKKSHRWQDRQKLQQLGQLQKQKQKGEYRQKIKLQKQHTQKQQDYDKLQYNLNNLNDEKQAQQQLPKIKMPIKDVSKIITKQNYREYLLDQNDKQGSSSIHKLGKSQIQAATTVAFAYQIVAEENQFVRLKNIGEYAEQNILPPDIKHQQQCIQAYDSIQHVS